MNDMNFGVVMSHQANLTLEDGKKSSMCSVKVASDGFSWWNESNLAGHIVKECLLTATVSSSSQGNQFKLHVYYVTFQLASKEIVAHQSIKTFCAAEEVCTEMKEKIHTLLNQLQRPKKILVFVNPLSGRERGVELYKTKVAPILELMGVEVNLQYTQSDPSVTDKFIQEFDLSSVDVVAVMGGDGSLASICKSLIVRCQRDNNLDINNADTQLFKPTVPIAVLPCGTGNGQAVMFNCSKNLESSALSLVLGHTQPRDIMTFYSNSTFYGISMIILGFGLMGTVREYVESKRWMGVFRYFLAIPALLKKRDPFHIDMEYFPVPKVGSDGAITPEKFNGPVLEANVFPILYPLSDPCSGNAMLIWVKPCTRSQKFSFLKRLLMADVKALTEMDFVGVAKVTQYKISTPVNNRRTCLLEWDGEVVELPAPNLDVRVRAGLVNVVTFDRAIIPPDMLNKFTDPTIPSSTCNNDVDAIS